MKYREYINALLKDSISEGQAVDQYGHLAKEATIRHYQRNGMLGDLIKRKDPIQYQVGKNEWEAEQRARKNRAL